MYIRRTSIKSRRGGEPYFTYRLVESVREGTRIRQRTVTNLGRHFDVPRDQWPTLVQRVEELLHGQQDLLGTELEAGLSSVAEHIAAQVTHARARRADDAETGPDFQEVDINSVESLRPRSVGLEHITLSAIQQLGLDDHLEALGINGNQRAAMLGNVVARMVAPSSELGTWHWLQQRSALGELIDFDYEKMPLMSLYRASDLIFKHKSGLEDYLYSRERSLFDFDEVITLYDLTNTYFEGNARANANAARGHSKEKRSDCPLVTLALVLDGSGFPRRSEILPGNVSEPGTLETMMKVLHPEAESAVESHRPTVVLDAGIATEANIAWLVEHHYRYLVVSRKRHRFFHPDNAETIRVQADGAPQIQVERVVNDDRSEVQLYCHSAQREEKDRAIQTQASQRYEAALEKINAGLGRKGTVKKYDKVLLRLGRLKEQYARASQHYETVVDYDEESGLATRIGWQRRTTIDQTTPGVYCLRSNQMEWDPGRLWHTYTLLTDLEAVFRCLKSELGLRPVFHHKTDRVSGHLFISVLAYHVVHTIRTQLKGCGIDLSWEGIRRIMASRQRITTQLKRADGRTVHVRKATRAEHAQQQLYDALGISARAGRTEKVVF